MILKKINFIYLFILVLLTFSCAKDDNTIDNNENLIDISSTFGKELSVNVLGQVIDLDGNPIAGADVSMRSTSVQTDENGIFIFNDAPANENFAYIKVSKAGFLDGSRSFAPSTGTQRVTIQLLDNAVTQTVSSGSSSSVNLANGASVSFTGDFIKEDGSSYNGNVSVIMHHLDPTNEIDNQMPGMLYAANENNEEQYLETFGMVVVELKGSAGEILNIDPNSPSEIRFPLQSDIVGDAPNSIPLWYFDEDAGYWREDGSASLQGNEYIGEVSHFSWWNCDAPFPVIKLCLTLVDPSNNPLTNVTVTLSSPNTNLPRSGVSDSDGQICGKVPYGKSLTMSVLDPCGNAIYSSTIGPFTSNTNLGNVIVSAPTQNIVGTFNTCNNTPVVNGYVEIIYANKKFYSSVTSGNFNVNFMSCAANDALTAEGFDYDNLQTTGVLNYTFTPPTTNLGTLTACNSITEFIEYTIDSDPTVYFLSDIKCELHNTNSFSVWVNFENKFFVLASNNTVLGTYDYGFEGPGNVMGFDSEKLWPNGNFANTYQFQLNSWGPVGSYVDISFSGTFYGYEPTPLMHTVTGTIHVIRDK